MILYFTGFVNRWKEMKIGVLGASFNPPTRGHEDVVNQALLDFDEVLLVPSILHPFGKTHLSLRTRLEMLRLFIKPWQKNNAFDPVKIFNIEMLIKVKNPDKDKIYTFDVLSELNEYYQSLQTHFSLQFIVGPDNADPNVWKKFYRSEDIIKHWGIWIAKENIPIHSKDVRSLIENNNLDDEKLYVALLSLVSEPIAGYIIEHRLYRKGE